MLHSLNSVPLPGSYEIVVAMGFLVGTVTDSLPNGVLSVSRYRDLTLMCMGMG